MFNKLIVLAFFFLSFSLLPNNYKSSHFLLFIFFYIFSYYFLSFYFLSKIILLIYLQATILQHPSSPSHSNINTHITTFMSFQQLNFPEVKFLFQKFNSISEIYFFQYIYIHIFYNELNFWNSNLFWECKMKTLEAQRRDDTHFLS